ncbi:MAG TPA: DUF5916 domain-containing protein [Kofleriaceae bacterium]|nr:DUF5916 domain-containing protein [Kofleriaceae bacterium]
MPLRQALMSPARCLVAALIVALAPGVSAPAAAAVGPAKIATAARATGPVHLDGALDEPAWQAAPAIADFLQKEPVEGAAPSHPTEVRVLFDADALYIGARMDAAPGRTRRSITRRDETSGAERFIVSLDPYRTGRIAYSFAVTVAGVRADWIHTDDSEYERDASWNPVWSAATRVHAGGWTAELRIPWSQLRYPRDGARPWGINFNRYEPDHNEDVFWIVVPRERTGWASYMGELRGLERPPRQLGLELVPYVAASLGVVDDGDLDPTGSVGLDARLRVGAGLSLDVAINPDFGQVEADPAVVNLGAFETAFAERRPFFVAGNEIFGSAPVGYFYSRRVGALPRDTVPDDATAVADAVRILGAAKLSGRIGERGTLGALAAITDDAVATTPTGEVAVAPRSAWGVTRLERELGASRLGASAAAVAHALDDDRLVVLLPALAAAGGVDGLHRWGDGAWELGGYAGGSLVSGDAAALTRIQTASSHYFQRPDATHKRLDPARTSLAGWHAGVGGGRRAGTLRGEASLEATSPGFDLNGPGLLDRSDLIAAEARGAWIDTTPSRRWQAWSLELAADSSWSFAGDRRASTISGAVNGTTRAFTELGVNGGAYAPGLSDTATRGGPLMRTGGGGFASLWASSTRGTVVTWSTSLSGEHAPAGTTGATASAAIGVRPSDHLRLELAPRVHAGLDRRQYVATVDDPATTATYGQRYVFAAIERLEVSAQLRAAITLTADLAIDVYVEPFVSRGRYDRLGELAAPGSNDLIHYARVRRDGQTVRVDDAGFSLPEPDFTARSLRSTAVLRWEPRAGSTLYAVWQQQRASDEPRARAVGPGLVDAFTAAGAHVFALKLAWWFAR